MTKGEGDRSKRRGLESLGEDKDSWVRKNIVIGRNQRKRWEEYIERSGEFANFSDFVRTACDDYIRRGGKKSSLEVEEEIRKHLAKYFESLSEGIKKGRPYLHYKIEEEETE